MPGSAIVAWTPWAATPRPAISREAPVSMTFADSLRRPDTWCVAGLVGIDQVTKTLVLASVPLHETIPIIPGLLNLTHVQNTGAAFGVLNAVDFPFKAVVVTVLAV